MKSLFYILSIFTLGCANNYPGTYSVCWGNQPTKKGCQFIILNPDSSFVYSDPFLNQETYGTWTISNDTLILNSVIWKYLIRTSNSNLSNSDSLIIRAMHVFKDVYSDCSYASIFTDQTNYLVADSFGVLTLDKKTLDSIKVSCLGCYKTEWIFLNDSIRGNDSLLIICNTQALGQIEMNDLKSRIYQDTVYFDLGENAKKLVKRNNRTTSTKKYFGDN